MPYRLRLGAQIQLFPDSIRPPKCPICVHAAAISLRDPPIKQPGVAAIEQMNCHRPPLLRYRNLKDCKKNFVGRAMRRHDLIYDFHRAGASCGIERLHQRGWLGESRCLQEQLADGRSLTVFDRCRQRPVQGIGSIGKSTLNDQRSYISMTQASRYSQRVLRAPSVRQGSQHQPHSTTVAPHHCNQQTAALFLVLALLKIRRSRRSVGIRSLIHSSTLT